jgi:glycosyltransferase involved in cell wall biosynthesis
MKWSERKNGISVLFASQNAEETLVLSVFSFLEFGDEIILVDNGSQDASVRLGQELAAAFPDKVCFYNAPELPDLHHNRQFAFERSHYRWVVRADTDFVAYTSGDLDIRHFREHLLGLGRSLLPRVYGAPLPNLNCDFWHTGLEKLVHKPGVDAPGRYVAPPLTAPNPRIYEVFPGFKFQRLGRWEGTSFNRVVRFLRQVWPQPFWMHCNLKSDRVYLFRSERTNWRELGDFQHYPTLESFVRVKIQEKYHTNNLDQAAEQFMQTHVYPFLQPYDPDKLFPYPELVLSQMERNPVYKLIERDDRLTREYTGSPSLAEILNTPGRN